MSGSPCVLDPAATPEAIEARSFAVIDEEARERGNPFSGNSWKVARRLVHAAGDVALLDALWLPDQAIEAGIRAIERGATVFTDTKMVRAGIPLRRLRPFGCRVVCVLDAAGLGETAKQRNTTRTRAGVEAVGGRLGGAIVAVGNAPTALLALLALLRSGCPAPALIIGMPVGFVNAAEAKELLIREDVAPALTVRGRRGGSPLAAATVNALACLAAERSTSGSGSISK